MSISSKLLKILAEKIKILDIIDRDGEFFYKIKKSEIKTPKSPKDENLNLSLVKNFSICLDPLIWIDKTLTIREECDLTYREIIYQNLQKIAASIKVGDKITRVYKIPPNLRGFNFSEGILVNGTTIGKLFWQDEKCYLLNYDKIICQISKDHPDYKKLKEEFTIIQSNVSIIYNSIEKKLNNDLNEENFKINLNIEKGELSVKIFENEIQNFSKIFQLFNEHNKKIITVPLNNDWFLNIRLDFECDNPILDYYIKCFKNLETELKANYLSLINKDKSIYISKLEMILNNIKETTKNTRISLSTENFLSILKDVCRTSHNNWYHIFYAKLIENEVFEQ